LPAFVMASHLVIAKNMGQTRLASLACVSPGFSLMLIRRLGRLETPDIKR
jgi:hypothetical protein